MYDPTQVGAATNWAAIRTGGFHTCATRSHHTLWCWGANYYGQLGLGDTMLRYRPQQVGTSTAWARLDGGGSYTCATRLDHTLWCWGLNEYGQLGLGDTANRVIPTQVGAGTDWERVSSGGDFSASHTCATRSDHTLWCWDDNGAGQLGLGDHKDRWVPRRV